MNMAQPTSKKPTSANLRGKPQLDVQDKQDALPPVNIYTGGKTSSSSPGDASANRPGRTAPTHPQQALGNQAVLRRLESGLNPASLEKSLPLQPLIGNNGVAQRLQTKLKVNTPGDEHEQEADRVAEQVMRMSNASTAFAVTGAASGVQRECACSGSGGKCDKCSDDEPKLQRSAAAPAAPGHAPPIVGQVLHSPGRPLDAATRAFMEPRFGHDFSQVRIHAGGNATGAAESVNALAYTVGRDVVFGAGQYHPESKEGRRLLAHELAHVVQQSRGGVSVCSPSQERFLELDAHRAASAVSQNGAAVHVGGASAARMARQQTTPQIPTALSFLTRVDIQKLQAFGPSDFQSSLNTLQGHLRKTQGTTTAGAPQQYIDIRQAAGEIRTVLDYIRDPDVVAVKVVPSASGGRSPDMYIRRQNGTEARVEIYNVTLASKDVRPEFRMDLPGQPPRIPKVENQEGGGTHVELPVNEFNVSAVRDAIRSKIKSGSKGPSQLVAQNPNTQVEGRPMATGGDVIIQITHGEVTKARLDQVMRDLEPELLASSTQRVAISTIDADEPRVGRKIFSYDRAGQSFVGSVRTPFYRSTGGPELPAPRAPALATAGKFLKTAGGAVFSVLFTIAVAFLLEQIRRWLEKEQIEAGVNALQPSIASRLIAKSQQIVEMQSASEEPVYATIKYSITFRHNTPDTTLKYLSFGEGEHDLGTNEAYHSQMEAEQNITYFAGANLVDVALGSGAKPENQEAFRVVRDKEYNQFEDLVSTFVTSVDIPRISNVDLRDYLLSQIGEAEGGEGLSPERAGELQTRLERLQGAVSREEARKRTEEVRARQEEERRKQAKLAAARAALAAPPPSTTPLLAPPGPPPVAVQLPPQADPFNLSGRPVPKSLLEQSQDAADIVEALKAEFLGRADAVKSGKLPDDQVKKYKTEVENWINGLHQVYQRWRTVGSPDWPSVKRIEYVNWWVEQPEGKTALLR